MKREGIADDLQARRSQMYEQRGAARAERVKATANVTLVTGPACSGKTTWVREHAHRGDLIIDFDAIASALTGTEDHNYPEALNVFAFEARDAVIDALHKTPGITAYLIASNPTRRDLNLASTIVELDDPAVECKRRARAAGRPPKWDRFIDEWWAKKADQSAPPAAQQAADQTATEGVARGLPAQLAPTLRGGLASFSKAETVGPSPL